MRGGAGAPFSVPLAGGALGGSLAYEEYRGDLAAARAAAERALGAARAAGDGPGLADGLLALGVVHTLQDEVRAAAPYFRELRALPGAPAAHRVRAAAWAAHAYWNDWQLGPDRGSGALGMELSMLAPRWADGQPELPRPEAYGDELRESVVWAEVAAGPRVWWGSRRFDHGVADMPEALRAQAVEAARGGAEELARFRGAAAAAGAPPSLLAYTSLRAANLLWSAGLTDEAQSAVGRATAEYAGLDDHAGLGACALTRGDWAGTVVSSPVLWNLSATPSGMFGHGMAGGSGAREFDGGGALDTGAAAAAYDAAEAHFRRAGAGRGLAAVRLRRTYLALVAGDVPAAGAHIAAAAEGFERTGDRGAAHLARVQQALVRVWAGEPPDDGAAARAAGAWGRDVGSLSVALGIGRMAARAGAYWLRRRGDYMRALACHRLAECLFEALGAVAPRARSLVDQADVYDALGERAAALGLYERALEVHAEARRAGHVYQDADQLSIDEVVTLHTVFGLALADKDPEAMQRTRDRLRFVAPSPAELDAAAANTASNPAAAALAGVLVELLSRAEALGAVLVPCYRADAALAAGDPAAAAALYDEALAAAGAAADERRDELTFLVLAHRRDHAGAAAAYRRHLERQGSIYRGRVAAWQESVIPADTPYGQRQTHVNRVAELQLAAMAFTAVRAYADAAACYGQIETLAGADWWAREERPWEVCAEYGEVRDGLGASEDALVWFDRGVEALERRRGALTRDELKTSLAGVRTAERLYFQAALAATRAAAAARARGDDGAAAAFAARVFDYAERGKARGLLDQMAGAAAAGGAGRAGAEAGPVDAWRALTARLTLRRGLLARERGQSEPDRDAVTRLEAEIAADEAALAGVERELAAADPAFRRALDPQADVIGVGALRAALPRGTALLQYYFLGDACLAWAVTADGLTPPHEATVDPAALARDMRALRDGCLHPGAPWEAPAEALARVFLDPLAGAITSNERLIVVPYGPAHELPFHVLPWAGVPLGAARTVSYLPSASALPYTGRRAGGGAGAAAGRVLAVGNPARMAYRPPLGGAARRLAPLPGAEAEAAYVAGLFGDDARLLLRDAATEAAVRVALGGCRVLHFATHGVVTPDTPLLSSVALAEGEGLSVYELMALRLDADLAVLSACDTARGRRTGGDDVLGLVRGLLGAGVRSAVVTLWPVADASTCLLVARFYEHYRAGDEPAAALRAAQDYLRALTPAARDRDLARLRATAAGAVRDVRVPDAVPDAGYAHPYYWAPFVVVG